MRHYREGFADTKKLADRVMQEIVARGIRPNPINFMVWYEFLLQRDSFVVDRLSMAVDHEETAKELFNHIVSRICVMNEIDSIVLKLVNEIIADMDNWEHNLVQHTEVLEKSLAQLADKTSDTQLASIVVKGVIASVQEMMHGAEDIKHKMLDARSEVDTLKKQLEMSYKEAHTDPLTGIGNRRAMDKFIAETIDLNNGSEVLSCILLDIDHFKKINDQYGHLVGDSVLRFIAKLLQQATKGQDFVARFGGEEFIILLPSTNGANAYTFAEKLRKTMQGAKLKVRNSQHNLTFTASIGVSTFRVGETIADFISRADRALYVAKSTGRNRVIDEIEALNTKI